jgi:hypothetical protein
LITCRFHVFASGQLLVRAIYLDRKRSERQRTNEAYRAHYGGVDDVHVEHQSFCLKELDDAMDADNNGDVGGVGNGDRAHLP